MRATTVDVKSSSGRILCCTVFRSGGKKLLAKGHVISEEDIRILESEGMENVWVTELEDGEVGEDDAVATVESTPFAVAKEQLEAITAILKDRGPILQARPVRSPSVGILYSDPVNGDRARQLFEGIMRQRLERFAVSANFVLACAEDEMAVSRALQHLVRSKPSVILVASTTAPAGPEDIVGRGMARIGGHMERFLAPVEPGNLLLLSYKDEIPIVSAPGCFRSAKSNVVDLMLPPLLARYRVSGWEIGCLGHGGLLA